MRKFVKDFFLDLLGLMLIGSWAILIWEYGLSMQSVPAIFMSALGAIILTRKNRVYP